MQVDDLFPPTTSDYFDGNHYVKPCSLCGAVVPQHSEFWTPEGLLMTGRDTHLGFHNRLERA